MGKIRPSPRTDQIAIKMYIVRIEAKHHRFSFFQVICSQLPVTQTPDNSNLFSISPEGSSYRDSTVYAFVTAEIKLELIREKPKRHFFSRQLLPRVKWLVSELSMRHMSTKSIESIIHLTFSRDFSCVTGLTPCLAFCPSETLNKVKIATTHAFLALRVRSTFRTDSTNEGGSLFGTQILTSVNVLLSVLISLITNLPFGSELVLSN